MRLLWVPSHVGIVGNDVTDSLARRPHGNGEPTIFLQRFVEAGRHLRKIIRPRHPDKCISLSIYPLPVPHDDILRSDTALLYGPWCNSAFTPAKLAQIYAQVAVSTKTFSVFGIHAAHRDALFCSFPESLVVLTSHECQPDIS